MSEPALRLWLLCLSKGLRMETRGDKLIIRPAALLDDRLRNLIRCYKHELAEIVPVSTAPKQ